MSGKGRRRAWVRLALGFAQMGGAVLSATFLATLGVGHPWTVAAVLITSALTATSLVLFPRTWR
jgi:Kef-type K+ transport system membrane component KefB